MKSEARIAELDGFRGAAVLVIVFLHFIVHHLQTTPATELAYAQKYLTFLWFGVDAFFVLSGFLIGGVLMDQRGAANYFRVFYLRRLLRIFPPYLLLLALWIAVQALQTGSGLEWLLQPARPAWPYFVYVQNVAMSASGDTGPNFMVATWSLAVEEQFYLLFPLVVRFLSPAKLPVVLCVGTLLAPTLRAIMALLGPEWEQAQMRLLPTRWDSLLLGASIAWSVRQPAILAALRARRRALCGLLIPLAALMAAFPLILAAPDPFLSPWRAFSVYLITAAFFALVLLLLHLRVLPGTARILSTRPMRFFGKISYFMYLFHIPILGLAFAGFLGTDPVLAAPRDWLVMAAAFALLVLLGESSWRWIEGPLVAMGHRVAYTATGGRAASERVRGLGGAEDEATGIGR